MKIVLFFTIVVFSFIFSKCYNSNNKKSVSSTNDVLVSIDSIGLVIPSYDVNGIGGDNVLIYVKKNKSFPEQGTCKYDINLYLSSNYLDYVVEKPDQSREDSTHIRFRAPIILKKDIETKEDYDSFIKEVQKSIILVIRDTLSKPTRNWVAIYNANNV